MQTHPQNHAPSGEAKNGVIQFKPIYADEPICKARDALFLSVIRLFKKAAEYTDQSDKSAVWNYEKAFEHRDMVYSSPSDRSYLRMFRPHDNLSASIAVRLADVRIAFFLPAHRGIELRVIDRLSGYSDAQADKPIRLSRIMGDGRILIDHLFNGKRLGDLILTSKALTGDPQAIHLLADALYLETLHIYASLLDAFSQSGILLDAPASSMKNMRFRTRLNGMELRAQFGLSIAEIECLEEPTLIMPMGMWEIHSTADKIEAVNQAIETDPDRFQEARVDRMMIDADGGLRRVPPQAPGSAPRTQTHSEPFPDLQPIEPDETSGGDGSGANF